MNRRTGLTSLFDDEPANTRRKVTALYVLLVVANVACWVWALTAFRSYPVLLGTALLAYAFGVRHAVDADHIAAIDNVTRKLMQSGKRPISAGFFFSLGHSSIVIAASVMVVLAVNSLQTRFEHFREIGGVVGTGISAFFLLAIAAANIVILAGVWRMFNAVRRGERLIEEELNLLLAQRGLVGRLLRSLFAMISRSWHMYPLGILFGLGFDTATEIGVLGISAAQGSQGLPLASVLVFPALFTAGMALVDTTDGVLMVGAYGWAFVNPLRKLYYNLTITLVSVVVALLIGGIEVLGLMKDKLALEGGIWTLVGTANDHFGTLGYVIIAVFAVCWLASVALYRFARLDELAVERLPGAR